MKQKNFLKTLFILFIGLNSSNSFSQLAVWNFTGDILTASTSEANTTVSDATHMGLTSTGSFFSCNGDAWSPSSWNETETINTADDYAEYQITAKAGFNLTVTGFTFTSRISSSGPDKFSIRSSNDTYASDLLTGTSTGSCAAKGGAFGTSISVSAGNSLTIRIYGYSATSTGNMRMDDVTITGTSVAATADTLISFVSSTSSVSEDGTSIDVCVAITNPDGINATTVEVALDGGSTAANPGDYTPATALPSTLTFPAGSSTNQCLTINLTDDGVTEVNETVVLNLQNQAGGDNATLGSTTQHTLTITDDDLPVIVISEIMYNTNTPGSDDEWIELYNDDNSSVDINGWTLDYASNSYTFSAATVIPSKSYITIAVGSNNDGNDFNYNADFPFEPDFNTLGHTTHSALVTTTAAGDTNKLTNSTAIITLKNASATVIDTVTYDDADTGGSHDGSGNSLEIIDVNADNSDPTTANWRSSSNTGGSPGASITSTWIGTTSGVWNLAGNWDNGIPTSTINAIIPVIVDITKRPTASVDISAKYLIIESGASLIVQSNTVSAEVTYKANVSDMNWHLMSSPVVGEQYNDDWNTLNFINVSGTFLDNDAVSTYDNTTDADGNWDYFQTGGATTTFDSGKGYSLNRTASGDYRFTGTFPESNITSTISQGFGGVNKWNLVGNPFPSYIEVSELIAANSTNLTDTHEFVYVWNGTNYVTLAGSDYIHPGQAFFVNAANSTADNFTIAESLQSHLPEIIFSRETNKPRIDVFINDNDNNQKFTEIRYAENTTKALDPGFDAGTFTGQSTSFSLFSHLVSNSEGVDFMLQSLPKDDYENTIIPLGLNADAGKEITFTADALNLPSGLKVFLEDRQTNTFTRLDENNSNYKITLNADSNGIGRFYLRTSASNVLSTDKFNSENLSVYKLDNSTIRITGLERGKMEVILYNILGEKILKQSFNSNGIEDISLPKVSTGIYIIKLQTETGIISKKIILE
jgi:hypothetical protein